jgi:predicted ATPase
MAIASVFLSDFTAFESATLDLCPGLNIFIGANGTGKTHVMKLLYAVTRALQIPGQPRQLATRLAEKLVNVFRPDDNAIGRLTRRSHGQKTATVEILDDGGRAFEFAIIGKDSSLAFTRPPRLPSTSSIFIPSREALSIFEGFAAAYQARELSFDETYFDLAISLSAAAIKGTKPPLVARVQAQLESALGAKVVLENGRFYAQQAGGKSQQRQGAKLEAHLMSEGMRKVASLLRLIANGEIRSTGLLFWDEPEANLNPKLTVLVASILGELASAGIQVVLASHDYLLTETLGIEAANRPPTRFFGFARAASGKPVTIEQADSLDALAANSIREEFRNHYDRVREAE